MSHSRAGQPKAHLQTIIKSAYAQRDGRIELEFRGYGAKFPFRAISQFQLSDPKPKCNVNQYSCWK